MHTVRLTLAALALSQCGVLSAYAQTSETPAEASPPPPQEAVAAPSDPRSPGTHDQASADQHAAALPETDADKDLTLTFSPYIWMSGFSGDVTVRNIDININKNFFQILDESDSVFGLMGAVDLSYHKFVFQYQGSWVTSEFSEEAGTVDTGTVKAKLDLEALWQEVFVGYRMVESPLSDDPTKHANLVVDAFWGARFTEIDVDGKLSSTSQITLPDGGVIPPGASVSRHRSESWFEPFVGVRAIFELDEHWVIQLRGDVGGFGVDGSDFAWQTIGVLGYQWRNDGWDVGVFGGYRALGQDYSSGDFGWDMITHGPFIGGALRLHF